MNSNKRGIFYGAIGVATLVVAVVGATFAYFSATASNAGNIAGTAATAGLSLVVTQVSNGTGPMVPQLESTLGTAMNSTNKCVDANGNTVCKVYSIGITNTGTSATVLNGTITFTGGTYANLYWIKTTNATTLGANTKVLSTNSTTGNLISSATLTASGSATYYAVVWINETNASQNATDTGTFAGTVSFNSASGTGVTSTFTS